jgi:hypothetical protein
VVRQVENKPSSPHSASGSTVIRPKPVPRKVPKPDCNRNSLLK